MLLVSIPLFLWGFWGARGDASSAVLSLTDATFDRQIGRFGTALVMFYAPWCDYSKELRPKFERAAQHLRLTDPDVAMVKVDCDKMGARVCDQNAITTYPTLKVFHNGKFDKEYDGDRETFDIVRFIHSETQPY